MATRRASWAAAAMLLPALSAAVPKPADWVPARWPWVDPASLELLTGSAVNCLLLKNYTADFVAAAAGRGIATLALLTPEDDTQAAVQRAMAVKVSGIALEGEFANAVAAPGIPVIELTTRSRMRLGSDVPILATRQGVWPGVAIQEDGAKRAGPTGSVWIDTNSGFLRAVRAWGDTPVWMANQPPPKTVVSGTRYLQAIADAAMCGARWVLAFDADFAARLQRREPAAIADWRRMGELIAYFEGHPEWRRMQPYAKLAIVQDPAKGGLLSGGILDMLIARHTPVRPVPPKRLTPEALRGASMAVNLDADALTPEQTEVLRGFTRSGGMLLTAPPGYQDQAPSGDRITLDQRELDRLADTWRDVNSMVGRRNLGVRLFNVSSMLSNLLVSADGKTLVLHLVNYSDYPVENVTMHFLGGFKRATLTAPGSAARPLEIYTTDEGGGVDLDKVGACATVTLEQ